MINVSIPETELQLRPRITVVGVGGAGGNAVNNMIQSNLEGCEFLVANTDAQALAGNEAERKLQLGTGLTQGLGAGSRPDIGRAAAEEVMDEIATYLDGSHMVFITAGMGGGTGTGAAPVIARAAREQNILTVGVVTKPFHFEGAHRMRVAEAGLNDLQQYVDTLIVIPNQNLFRIANERTTFADAFKMADEVLSSGVRGVTDLMVMPGLINLDFADIRTVMAEMGKAMMGTGEDDGERRAVGAAEAAISNPLLDDVSMKGARGVLINITGGLDMTLYEVDEAINRVRDEVDADANIIFGSTFDESMEGRIRVSVVSTGIDLETSRAPNTGTAGSLSVVSDRTAPTPAPAGAAGGTQPAGPARGPAPSARSRRPRPQHPRRRPPPLPARPRKRSPRRRWRRLPSRREPNAGTAPSLLRVRWPARHPRRPRLRRSSGMPPNPLPRRRWRTLPAGWSPGAGRNIFRRMTGLLREDEQPQAAPKQPTVQAQPEQQQPSQSAQPRLSGLDVGQRGPLPSAEDDQLDIPAFLRRQAN